MSSNDFGSKMPKLFTRISAIAASTAGCVRPLTTTRAPSPANAVAMAKPIPAVLPLTKASLSFRPRSIASSLSNEKQGLYSFTALAIASLLSRPGAAEEARIVVLAAERARGLRPVGVEQHDELWFAQSLSLQTKVPRVD